MGRVRKYFCFAAASALLLSACAGGSGGQASNDSKTDNSASGQSAPAAGGVLERVKEAGVVRCGTRDDLPGFAVKQSDGTYEGFDNDYCRAVAVAVFGDAEKVEFVPLETADRFSNLQSGEVDVLIRNTTWTASRDGKESATFLQPIYYDGQGMMVRSDSGYNSLEDMDGATICVPAGTTSEGNVASEFERLSLSIDVLSQENTDLIQESFIAGRCDGWSGDRTQLAALRTTFPEGPEALLILDDIFSKEPLAPAVADGDAEWAQIVNWAVFATIQAEELFITSENVEERRTSDDPTVRVFLGVESDGTVLNPGLGMVENANLEIIKQVGNYGEIFERHFAPLGIERGLNEQWRKGGLLYAPPFR